MREFSIGSRLVGDGHPTYFIADISANHDGDLTRAKTLIGLAAKSGADAAKFQSFRAPMIVSERGFLDLGSSLSHQASWKKSVTEVYRDASLPWEWTPHLKEECINHGIDFFSTPYDLEAVDMLDPYVEVFKIGSGDITWPEMLERVADKGKPVILATGASDIGEVQRAVRLIKQRNSSLALLQCNTNYTGSLENFKHIHLNVIHGYSVMFRNCVVGLSDHTPGHSTVLGAVAMGARIVEKHFTDDTTRVGPDHPFSMTPDSWRGMVERTRELENALGEFGKVVAENEQETVVVQRRCLRAGRNLGAGTILSNDCLAVLRPAPKGSICPFDLDSVLGKRLLADLEAGEAIRWETLSDA